MIYMKQIDLPYRELDEGENLYDDVDLECQDIVSAQYMKRGSYQGIADICALPRPATMRELMEQNSVSILDYDPEEVKTMKNWERKLELLRLKDVRYPFVFHGQIENFLAMALVSAYRARRMAVTEREGVREQDLVKGNVLSTSQQISSNVQGLSVIGTSGCGKSTAFQMVAAKYPKAIFHNFEEYSYIQIPIMMLTAYANGNLTALFIDMAVTLDRILDSGTRHYDRVRGIGNLGKMSGVVCDWIRIYHIGVLAIDEIQLMDFNSNSAKSFENLLTITATTGVSLVVLGTEDALRAWGGSLRIQRRTESVAVKADDYCKDREFMYQIIRMMWRYQWTTDYTELTQEIMEAMYEESMGSIDLLTSLWMMVQYEAMEKKNRQPVDAEFVRKVAVKRFSRMKELVRDSLVESQYSFKQEGENIKAEIRKAALEEKDRELKKTLEDEFNKNINSGFDREASLGRVIQAVRSCYEEYSVTMIRKAFSKAEMEDGFGRLKPQQQTKKVLEILQKRETGEKTGKRKKRECRTQDLEEQLQHNLGAAI